MRVGAEEQTKCDTETNTETLLPVTIPQFSYLGSNHSLVFFIRSQIYAMLFFR